MKRTQFTITRNKVDSDMLELTTHTKSEFSSRPTSILWAVVNEDFISDDIYLQHFLEQEGSIEVTLTLTS